MRLERYRRQQQLAMRWLLSLMVVGMAWQTGVIFDAGRREIKMLAAITQLQATVDEQEIRIAELKRGLQAEVRLAALVDEVVGRKKR